MLRNIIFCENMTIENIKYNILITISLSLVILLQWPKGLQFVEISVYDPTNRC